MRIIYSGLQALNDILARLRIPVQVSPIVGCLTLLVISSVIGACGSSAQRDQSRFEKNQLAVTEVRRIRTSLARSQNVSLADLDLLKATLAKYPNAPEVRQTLEFALQARQDWQALERLLTEKSESERTPAEQVFLAKVYIKLGKYKDASRIVGPMSDAAPGDVELNSLAGDTWYFEGEYDKAVRAFDRVWDAIVASEKVDEMMMRGMIYFYKGDKDRAIEVLKRTVEINPDYIAGNSALSRVYASKGDLEQAEKYRTQAEKAHARNTAEESRRMRGVSKSRDLESAFQAGRYDESIQIARELLQYADDSQKPVLYDYLEKAYRSSGRETEARAAAHEAARLREQTSR